MDIEIRKIDIKSGEDSVFEYNTFTTVKGRGDAQVEVAGTVYTTTVKELTNERDQLQLRINDINDILLKINAIENPK